MFCKEEGEAAPTDLEWDVFRAKYGGFMSQCQTTVLPITGGFGRRSAGGTARPVEGQTVGAEWNGSSFTPDMLEHLAEVHTSIEEKAVVLSWEELSQVDAWLEDELFAPVATIPKDDNGQPGPIDLRLITVTSLLYASWASTRFRDLQGWIARRVDESVVGGREGKQVQEVVWP